jgi:hypothetical protein
MPLHEYGAICGSARLFPSFCAEQRGVTACSNRCAIQRCNVRFFSDFNALACHLTGLLSWLGVGG